MASMNHVATCVSDLDRAIRFYAGVFGFAETHRLDIPDGPASQLLRVPAPVGLRAVYLSLGDAVLELLVFDGAGTTERGARPFTEPGLTHLSFTVDDLDAACGRVLELGGEVLDDTNVGGFAVMVRDPDGQVLELLPASNSPA